MLQTETNKNKNSFFHLMIFVCPYCKKEQTEKPIKEWAYGKTSVNRYKCKCGKMFNHYQSKKSSWTVPRPQ